MFRLLDKLISPLVDLLWPRAPGQPDTNPLWQKLLVLLGLALPIVLGMVVYLRTLDQWLKALAFGAGVLLIGWLWQRTLADAANPPLTRQARIRARVLDAVGAAAILALLWFIVAW
jgi:hypothetical protein